MRGQLKTPIWIVFSIISLYIVILIAFNVIIPVLMRFYDPCWGRIESRLNRIVPASYEFREEYTVNISHSECVSRISFSQKRGDYCEKEGKLYIMAEPAPLARGMLERIGDAVKQNIFFSETRLRERNPICIYTNTTLELASDKKWELFEHGNYSFIISEAGRDDEGKKKYAIDYKFEPGVFGTVLNYSMERTVKTFGLPRDTKLLSENINFRPCLSLLRERSGDNYLLFVVSDPSHDWYRMAGGWGNLYLITHYSGNSYSVYGDDREEKEFEQIDCYGGIGLSPYIYESREPVSLSHVLKTNTCEPDPTSMWSIDYTEMADGSHHIVNNRCWALLEGEA